MAGEPAMGLWASAIFSPMAMAAGFGAGALLAQPRWAPLEAHRSGSPLLADDRVRLRTTGSGGRVGGRLVDLTPEELVLSSGGEVITVPRADIELLQRADGIDLRRGALYGATGGALLGVANCHLTYACRGAETTVTAVAGALLGVTLSPALAPRRWAEVRR
jgi:hypothetical protein